MSLRNEEFINDFASESLVIYSDDNEFTVLSVNYKMAESAFLAAKGRRFNEEELEEVKTAFAVRVPIDKRHVEETALESCERNHGLIMTGQTLDAGVEAFIETVTAEVQEELVHCGISYTYTVAGHPESAAKLSRYVAAAETCEA